jgi:cell division septal protein FtsQ
MIAEKKTLIPLAGVIGLVAALVSLVVYMQNSSAFEITYIGIRGNMQLDPEDLVKHLNIKPHTNIFQIQLDEIQKRLETLQWVKTATVFRNVPNKLRIDITEREPFALVKLDQLHIIDKDGVVLGALASGSPITLPIMTGNMIESMNADGENPQLQQALRAIDRLMQTSPPVVKDVRKVLIQSLENATIISYDPAYPEIRVSLRDDAASAKNIEQFQQIAPTLQVKEAEYIDLRFGELIIVK